MYNASYIRTFKKFLINVYGEKCMRCGSESKIELDHIKPVSKYPNLKYIHDNFQLLCKKCNSSKGNRYIKSYIPKMSKEEYFDELLKGLEQ